MCKFKYFLLFTQIARSPSRFNKNYLQTKPPLSAMPFPPLRQWYLFGQICKRTRNYQSQWLFKKASTSSQCTVIELISSLHMQLQWVHLFSLKLELHYYVKLNLPTVLNPSQKLKYYTEHEPQKLAWAKGLLHETASAHFYLKTWYNLKSHCHRSFNHTITVDNNHVA